MTRLIIESGTDLDDGDVTFRFDDRSKYLIISDAKNKDRYMLNIDEAAQMHAWLGECLKQISDAN